MESTIKAVASTDYDLYACYKSGESGGTIHVLLDDTNGLSIEDCMKVSQAIDDYLDHADLDRSNISIEVSSPGIDRPLLEARHFQAVIGEMIKIKLHNAIDETLQKSFTAKLIDATGDKIIFKEKKNYELESAYDNISKAFLVYTKRRGEK